MNDLIIGCVAGLLAGLVIGFCSAIMIIWWNSQTRGYKRK